MYSEYSDTGTIVMQMCIIGKCNAGTDVQLCEEISLDLRNL